MLFYLFSPFPPSHPKMEHVRLLRTGSVMDDLKAYARDEKVTILLTASKKKRP